MIPMLYEKSETAYTTRGLGALQDTISCKVEEEANGIFILTLVYPSEGVLFDEIRDERQILAKPNAIDRAQPFRIVSITSPINGQVTIEAEHVHYQTNGVTVMPFTANNASGAAAGMVSNSANPHPFTFITTKTTQAYFRVDVPTPFRQLLGGIKGSMLDTFGGGEYEFDRYNIQLHAQRGRDNGVEIQYGRDILDFEQEKNIAELITGVVPFWTDGEGTSVYLPEKYIKITNNFAYDRIIPLDLSGDFEETPTKEQLQQAAQDYLSTTEQTKPKVSIAISFLPIWDTDEYRTHPLYPYLTVSQRLRVFDIVSVKFPELNVDVKAKIIRTVYDVMLERYDEIEIGEPRADFTATVLEQQQQLNEKPSADFMARYITMITDAITGVTGGHVIFRPKTNPQEILIMDTDDVATAMQVMRLNLAGIAFSLRGIDGPYENGWLLDGTFVSKKIGAIKIDANIAEIINLSAESIVAGVLKSKDGKAWFNLDDSIFSVSDGQGFQMTLDPVYGLRMYVNSQLIGWFDTYTTSYGNNTSNLRTGRISLWGNSSEIGSITAVDADNAQHMAVNGDIDINGLSAVIRSGGSLSFEYGGKFDGRSPVWQPLTINGTQYNVLVGE